MKDLTDQDLKGILRAITSVSSPDILLGFARAAIAADRALNAPEYFVKRNSEFIRVRAQLEREWSELKEIRDAEKNRAPADRDVMRTTPDGWNAALTELRDKVEGQTALWHYGRPTLDRASVLALIDKMGGKV